MFKQAWSLEKNQKNLDSDNNVYETSVISIKTALNAENVTQRKCHAHKKSRKILCNLRDIFFVQIFFHHRTTFDVRDFFQNLFFWAT